MMQLCISFYPKIFTERVQSEFEQTGLTMHGCCQIVFYRKKRTLKETKTLTREDG